MGNVHSAETPRRLVATPSNKLVKFRLGGPATAGPSSSNACPPSCDEDLPQSWTGLAGDHTASSRLSNAPPASPSVPFPPLDASIALLPHPLDASHDDRQNPMVSDQKKRERSRRSIFRSKSTSARAGSVQPSRPGSPERRNTTTAAIPPPLPPLEGQGVAPPSRRNSMLAPVDALYHDRSARESWNIADSRVSWNYDLTSYEAKRLLNLVSDSPATMRDESSVISENKYSVVPEITWKSSHPPSRPESISGAQLSRANSELSLYTPVRRRSVIQTPGVATRRNTSRGPPVSSHRYSHPPTPNMSRQPSSESLSGRVLSMPPIPSRLGADSDVRGPVTPCEGDYQTIGAFKLGTLRIVNGSVSPGAASPEPDTKHKVDRPAVPQEVRKKESGYFKSKSAATGAEKTRNGARREVDLKIRTDAPHSAIRSARLSRSPATPAKSPAGMSPSLLHARGSEGVGGLRGRYLGDIDSSPISVAGSSPCFSGPIPSPLLTTSKANAVEDMLFDDEAQPEYSTLEVLDLRLDPNAKSDPVGKNSPVEAAPFPTVVRRVTRSDSGFASSSPSSEHPHKPLSKTDSGYSSNVSLRSLRYSKQPLPEGDHAWSTREGQRSSLNSPLGDVSFGDSVFADSILATSPPDEMLTRRIDVAPPPPPKDFVASSRASKSKSGAEKPRAASAATPSKAVRTDSLPLNSKTRTWDIVSRSPDSDALSPRSTSSDTSSKFSFSSVSQKGGRLHRLLSRGSSGRSRGVPAVHAAPAVSKRGDAPTVPRDGQRSLHTHSGQFHGGSKRLGLKSQVSRDTLKTILSVGSLEARAADAAHNVEAAFESGGMNRRHTYTPSSLGKVASVSTDDSPVLQPVPRKPVPIRKDSDDERDVKIAESGASEHESATVEAGPSSVAPSALKDLARTTARDDNRMSRLQDRDELHFSPSVSEISIIGAIPLPPSDQDGQPSPSLVSPVAPEMASRAKVGTPPPVSMKTRKQGNLRVPPPLRPQSASPGSAHGLAPSRKVSQEVEDGLSAHRQEALEQLTGAPVPSAPLSAPLQPRRAMTLEVRASRSFTRTPDWQVKTDHDTSRRSSMDVRPEDPPRALEIVNAEHGHGIRRPSSVQPSAPQAQLLPHQGQQLRHRASYDDRTRRQMQYLPPQQQMQQRPAKPSTDPRWIRRQTCGPYAQQHHPWEQQQYQQQHQWQRQQHGAQWDEQQYWDQSQQWDKQQQGRYPPCVPRVGHVRNNSLGSAPGHQGPPPNPPYRILHSYNSPAYRNAPIWG